MDGLRLALLIFFHPADAFRRIQKDRDRFDYRPTVLILFLLVVVRISYIFMCHYPLADLLPRDTNIFLEMVKMLVPLITWAVACYAVTAIIGGSSLMRETLMAFSYCMLPYLVFILPLAALSHGLSISAIGLYKTLQSIIWIWVGLLLIISIKVMNDYTLLQTIWICFLGIITVLLIWAAFLLVTVLTGQLVDFIRGIGVELKMFRR